MKKQTKTIGISGLTASEVASLINEAKKTERPVAAVIRLILREWMKSKKEGEAC